MKKENVFKFVFIGIIVFIILILELLLNIFHYGFNSDPFKSLDKEKKYYVDNSEYIKKYYSFGEIKDFNKNLFIMPKPQGITRGFIIGGSTAEGFPYYPNQSFSKIAEKYLNIYIPNRKYEIINVGYAAMDSFYVKDVIKNLIQYDPDFIIIYSGHNEYFGTLGYAAGQNSVLKNIYLALSEIKIFQFVYNIINAFKSQPSGGNILMEQVINNKTFAPDNKIDEIVSKQFIDNINEAYIVLNDKNIPLIIIDPICNLYYMPPFVGKNDSEMQDFIKKYRDAFYLGSKSKIEEYYKDAKNNIQYSSNANILYLNALAEKIIYTNDQITNFIEAKDYDCLPFRAKSVLKQELKKYCENKKGIIYIPLEDEILKNHKNDILGNEIFIDHLHLNHTGQKIVGRILASYIAKMYEYPQDIVNNIITNEKANIDEYIMFYPEYDIEAYTKIKILLNNPPYNKMLIPYIQTTPSYNDIDSSNIMLLNYISQKYNSQNGQNADIHSLAIEYFISINDGMSIIRRMKSYIFNNPGKYTTYLNLARFLNSVNIANDDMINSYINAYLFSGNDISIYLEMKEVFEKQKLLLFLPKYQ